MSHSDSTLAVEPDQAADTALPSMADQVSPDRQRPNRLRQVARIMALTGMWAIWFVALMPTGLGGPVGMVWVSGTSMQPGLVSGDLVMTYERASYDVGDIVAFEIPTGGLVIHRITAITADGNYRFQGDNRKYEDPWELPQESIVGSSVIELHKAGVIVQWLSRPITLAVMVAALTLLHMRDRTARTPAVDRDEHAEPPTRS